MKIKGKLTTILFACALLATVGGENVRAYFVDAGAAPCDQSEAENRCPTTCTNWGGTDAEGIWPNKDENSGWMCATNGNLKCDCAVHRTFL